MNSDSELTARAIRVARATLYRWEKDAEPKSCRPKRTRPKTWTSALVEAVEHVRLDFPMWRRAKLGPPLRTEGFKVSDANQRRSVGRACRQEAWESFTGSYPFRTLAHSPSGSTSSRASRAESAIVASGTTS
jgi:hypothetical protein